MISPPEITPEGGNIHTLLIKRKERWVTITGLVTDDVPCIMEQFTGEKLDA